MSNVNQEFDVVISGGGLSGSLLALSLSQLSKADGSLLSIAIIETSSYVDDENNKADVFDGRVLALSHGSAHYLAKIGIWPLLNDQACPIKDIDISDRGHFGKARLNAEQQGVNALGYVIDMALIGKAQLKALANYANITWFSPDTISDIKWRNDDDEQGVNQAVTHEQNTSQITIVLNSAQRLSTRLLLACAGAQSPCRQFANIDVKLSEYNQSALIANLATAKPHLNKAFERFTEYGPIALLPLNNHGRQTGQGRCSLVWTMPPEQAQKMLTLEDDAFKVELELAFGSWLGAITQVGKRDVFPLKLVQAKQQTYHRMALVGNASHTIHPIAGQGFNLGLRDVEVVTSLIKKAIIQQEDIGSFSLLQQYQQHRMKDQQQIISLTDSLVTIFSNNIAACALGRNIGLQALNCLSPLKNELVKKTMGY